METKHLRKLSRENLLGHQRTIPSQSLSVREYLRLYGNKPSTYSLYEIGAPNVSADAVDPLLAAQEAKYNALVLQRKFNEKRNAKMAEYRANMELSKKSMLSAAEVNDIRMAFGSITDYLKSQKNVANTEK